MELVDAAIPSKHLDPVRQTILQVEGVKVCYIQMSSQVNVVLGF